MTVNPLEDPFYYLTNFQQVLAWLQQRYADVLSPQEQAFIERFGQLPRASQALLVRMVMRKGEHFRLGKLQYPEIGATALAVQPLLELGWVDDQAPLTLDQVFEVLLKGEILACFGAAIDQPKAKKAAWLDALRESFPQPQTLHQWYPALDDRLLSLTIMDLCDRLRLMFFGNLYQDWSDSCWRTWASTPTKRSSSAPSPGACAAVRTSRHFSTCMAASKLSKAVRT